ncbi:MAG: hypothetical protein RBU30_20465 [Polyangia bacterium]|nr:hypothetical protein [Polyangia bacterium]
MRPDASVTCEDQAQWEAVAAPLDRIEVLNPQWGGDGIPSGVAVRIAASLTYTGCDEMGGVQAQVFPQDRAIILTGFAWRYHGPRPCPYLASTGTEYFSFQGLRAGEWTVADYLLNSPGTPFTIRPCDISEDCICDRWEGTPGDWGFACDFDCMCAPPLGCNYEGMTSMGPQCYETCSVSSDCPRALFCNEGFLPQTQPGVCLATGMIEACESDSECPPGHTCEPDAAAGYSLCVATMATQPMGRPCDDDCDCPAGFSCIYDPAAFAPTCQIRCRGNRDCPRGTQCDPLESPAGAGANALLCQFSQMP